MNEPEESGAVFQSEVQEKPDADSKYALWAEQRAIGAKPEAPEVKVGQVWRGSSTGESLTVLAVSGDAVDIIYERDTEPHHWLTCDLIESCTIISSPEPTDPSTVDWRAVYEGTAKAPEYVAVPEKMTPDEPLQGRVIWAWPFIQDGTHINCYPYDDAFNRYSAAAEYDHTGKLLRTNHPDADPRTAQTWESVTREQWETDPPMRVKPRGDWPGGATFQHYGNRPGGDVGVFWSYDDKPMLDGNGWKAWAAYRREGDILVRVWKRGEQRTEEQLEAENCQHGQPPDCCSVCAAKNVEPESVPTYGPCHRCDSFESEGDTGGLYDGLCGVCRGAAALLASMERTRPEREKADNEWWQKVLKEERAIRDKEIAAILSAPYGSGWQREGWVGSTWERAVTRRGL